VAEAAARVCVGVSTLRSWEGRYGLAPRGRTHGGHRRYTAEDVARLRRIYDLVLGGIPTGAAASAVREVATHHPRPRRATDAEGRQLQPHC
jgi:DNA-binding transcriptional MerR regulator